MHPKNQKGFTLLEILLVIAAIGILAAIVIVAINPNRQLAQVRDAERRSSVNAVQKALEQYLIDNNDYPSTVTAEYQEVCNTGSNGVGEGSIGSDCADLRALVPDYLAAIPTDPQGLATESGYFVWQDEDNNQISVISEGEQTEVIAVNYTNEVISEDQTLYLDAGNTSSYPGSGNLWTNLISGGTNGTLVNGVGFDSANLGSLTFDGVDDYVSLGSTYTNTYIDITVSAWYYPTASSGNQYIVSKYPFGNGWFVYYNANAQTFNVDGRENGDVYITVNGTDVAPRNNWHHVTFTKVGATWSVYVNGQLDQTLTIDSGTVPFNNAGTFSIGRLEPISAYSTGRVGQVFVYDRAISDQENVQNYNATKSRYGY